MENVEQLRFMSEAEVVGAAKRFGTPVFVYDEATLRQQADEALDFQTPHGLTVRYAMKANPNATILRLFDGMGIHIDASSEYEAVRAMHAGIDPSRILVTSQQFPKNIQEIRGQGVKFNACSLRQLEEYGKLFPGTSVGVRLNPGLGSGHSNRTNVGGPASSFGIWHQYSDKIKALANQYNLTIDRIHTHIGSGSDPTVWAKAAQLSLEQVTQFPDATTLNLGGGFKIARMEDDHATDMHVIGKVVEDALQDFERKTRRKLHLEIEPGTFLVANAGTLISTIDDKVDTGVGGYTFLKLDSGMTDVLRPSLYGAQHPIVVVNNRPPQTENYVVVGHCCESGDLLTPAPGDPESIAPRRLQYADIGDLAVIEGVGAYCASMNTHGYNSFPTTRGVLRKIGGGMLEICRPGTPDELIQNEVITD